jgi:hypothetical protein
MNCQEQWSDLYLQEDHIIRNRRSVGVFRTCFVCRLFVSLTGSLVSDSRKRNRCYYVTVTVVIVTVTVVIVTVTVVIVTVTLVFYELHEQAYFPRDLQHIQ